MQEEEYVVLNAVCQWKGTKVIYTKKNIDLPVNDHIYRLDAKMRTMAFQYA